MRRIVISIILLAMFGAGMWYYLRPVPAVGMIHFFDVGQGDAALVSQDHFQVLIDGGPDFSVLSKLGTVMPIDDRTIEAVYISHPHADHYRGINGVLDHYQVGLLFISPLGGDGEYQAILDKARREGVTVRTPGPGDRIRAGQLAIDPLYPGSDIRTTNPNNASLVLRVRLAGLTVLFPGDAETEEESKLISSVSNLRATILKVGHHGSRTSSTDAFIDLVRPEAAVISVGSNNRYHHPARSTIENYTRRHIRTFRTDQNGTISVRITGTGWVIKPSR